MIEGGVEWLLMASRLLGLGEYLLTSLHNFFTIMRLLGRIDFLKFLVYLRSPANLLWDRSLKTLDLKVRL